MTTPWSEHDAVRLLRRRIGLALVTHYLLGAAAMWLFAWGVIILILRSATDVDSRWLLCGTAGLPTAIIAAVFLTWRRMPTERTLRALIDAHSRSGGLVVAAGEVNIDSWRERLSAIVAPTVRYRDRRGLLLTATGCLFLAGSILMPTWPTAGGASRPLEIRDEIDQMKQQLAVLEEEKVVAPEKIATFGEKLDQIRDQANGDGPVRTWEALDHLKNELAQAAKAISQEAVQSAERLAAAESLAQGIANDFASLDDAAMAAAMNALSALLEQAGAERDAAVLTEALDQNALSAELLEQLAQALKAQRLDNARLVDRLIQGHLIDAQLAELLEELEPCDVDGLAVFLAECDGLCPVDAAELWAIAGRGGMTRGPGPAAMTWKDETDSAGAAFNEQTLPPGTLAALRDSARVAVSMATPDADPSETADGQGTGLLYASGGAGSARTQTILPRHRGPVARYFARETSPNSP